MTSNCVKLSVEIAGIKFKAPLLPASGTFGVGVEIGDVEFLNRLPGLIIKTLFLNPRPGNPPPRLYETPCGLLNSVGIPSEGYDVFVEKYGAFLSSLNIPIVISIGGETIEDFVKLACLIQEHKFVSALEVNVSCPNIKRGKRFDDSLADLAELLAALRSSVRKPLFVKLSPRTDIVDRASVVAEYGGDAVVIANTWLGMAIDVYRKKPVFASIYGGLSGPAIKPLTLALVWQVAETVKLPIIASGGINKGADVLEYLMAGAYMCQVGTANLINYTSILRIEQELLSLMCDMKIKDIVEVIGAARGE
jgi:dihydroorotate dehydrogenase (NAD+) catalytic subunit